MLVNIVRAYGAVCGCTDPNNVFSGTHIIYFRSSMPIRYHPFLVKEAKLPPRILGFSPCHPHAVHMHVSHQILSTSWHPASPADHVNHLDVHGDVKDPGMLKAISTVRLGNMLMYLWGDYSPTFQGLVTSANIRLVTRVINIFSFEAQCIVLNFECT